MDETILTDSQMDAIKKLISKCSLYQFDQLIELDYDLSIQENKD